jgi:hypothetical protein
MSQHPPTLLRKLPSPEARNAISYSVKDRSRAEPLLPGRAPGATPPRFETFCIAFAFGGFIGRGPPRRQTEHPAVYSPTKRNLRRGLLQVAGDLCIFVTR